MNKFLLTVCAFGLLLSFASARAADAWEGDFRKCHVSAQLSQGILHIAAGQKGIDLEIQLNTEHGRESPYVEIETKVSINDIRKALDFLQKCDKFWTCVADRDLSPRPKYKHCFLPRDMRD
jgi:hypothetical protein